MSLNALGKLGRLVVRISKPSAESMERSGVVPGVVLTAQLIGHRNSGAFMRPREAKGAKVGLMFTT